MYEVRDNNFEIRYDGKEYAIECDISFSVSDPYIYGADADGCRGKTQSDIEDVEVHNLVIYRFEGYEPIPLPKLLNETLYKNIENSLEFKKEIDRIVVEKLNEESYD